MRTVHALGFAISAITAALVLPGSAQPCSPQRATATAFLNNSGSVLGAAITDGGCGYTNTPLVVLQGGGGSGATATAVVSNGVVVNLTITAPGSGYFFAPSVYIYSPQGLQVGLTKAFKVSTADLLLGTNYQFQVSGDLVNWTNQGAWFTASNTTMTVYLDVGSWDRLFFRMQPLTSTSALAQVCIDNLRQINDAIRQFRVDHNLAPSDPVQQTDITPYLKSSLVCPAGGTSMADSYYLSDLQTKPQCISPGGGAAHGHVLSTNVPPPYP